MKRLLAIVLAFTAGTANAKTQHHPVSPRRQTAPAPIAVPDPGAANAAFIRGDYLQATSLYSTLLASAGLRQPQKELAYLSRGYANLRLNRVTEATADLRQAVALDPADPEATNALFVAQNRGTTTIASPSPGSGWGPLVRLPGRNWIVAKDKAVFTYRFEWAKVGIVMVFAGKDPKGNRIEGSYLLDPARDVIHANYTYRGKAVVSEIETASDHFTETGTGPKSHERQVTKVQPDGTFVVTTERLKGKGWEAASTSTLLPASEQMIASLGWPDQPVQEESFLHGILRNMKEGALAGFKEGTQAGLTEAVQYRVHQITGTPNCRTVNGEIVKCP
jgi:tetratricopeptide (TPR) repeat protein